MTTHAMIDIETAGKTANAAIASIGAVLFDPHGDWIGDAFHMHVDLESCVGQWKMEIDPSTFIWWLGQSDAARKAFVDGQQRAASLSEALSAFSRFLPKDVTPWCNGASFDFAILANAYHAVKKPLPWDFWKERCLRTLKGMNAGLSIERTGTHHNALDDARHQARLVQHIIQFNPDMDS